MEILELKSAKTKMKCVTLMGSASDMSQQKSKSVNCMIDYQKFSNLNNREKKE